MKLLHNYKKEPHTVGLFLMKKKGLADDMKKGGVRRTI